MGDREVYVTRVQELGDMNGTLNRKSDKTKTLKQIDIYIECSSTSIGIEH